MVMTSTSDNDNIFVDLLFHQGLYEKVEITEGNILDLISLMNGQQRIHCYCPQCKQTSIFLMKPLFGYIQNAEGSIDQQQIGQSIKAYQARARLFSMSPPHGEKDNRFHWTWRGDDIATATETMTLTFVCAMEESHKIHFSVITDDHYIKKIGQHPSVADLTYPEFHKFKIPDQDKRELRMARGLYAHGVGVGSYVYLRRVLERIILATQNEAIEAGTHSIQSFSNIKVFDRIQLLKDYLPAILVNNAKIYGILSKGIHELSEEQCKSYFPIIQDCIMLTLKESEQKREQKESERRIHSLISNINPKA